MKGTSSEPSGTREVTLIPRPIYFTRQSQVFYQILLMHILLCYVNNLSYFSSPCPEKESNGRHLHDADYLCFVQILKIQYSSVWKQLQSHDKISPFYVESAITLLLQKNSVIMCYCHPNTARNMCFCHPNTARSIIFVINFSYYYKNTLMYLIAVYNYKGGLLLCILML